MTKNSKRVTVDVHPSLYRPMVFTGSNQYLLTAALSPGMTQAMDVLPKMFMAITVAPPGPSPDPERFPECFFDATAANKALKDAFAASRRIILEVYPSPGPGPKNLHA